MADTLEQRIEEVKSLSEAYKKLSDTEKVVNTDLYNNIIIKQKECSVILSQIDLSVGLTTTDLVCDDSNFSTFIDKLNGYKAIIDSNSVESLQLHELLELHKNILQIKSAVDSYIKSKKMTIIDIA